MRITVENQTILVQSRTFTARLEGAALVSVVHRGSGSEFCRPAVPEKDFPLVPSLCVPTSPGQLHGKPEGAAYPLELLYRNGDVLRRDAQQQTHITLLSHLAVRVIVSGADSERELLVRLDPETGDLCITPAGQSRRCGVTAVRWNIPFAGEARLLLPCVNGLSVEKDRAFPGSDRFPWPFRWNAQLAIAERPGCSLMVHAEDTACTLKALCLLRDADGLSTLGFDTEQQAPLEHNRAAGSLEWRLNVYDGDWHAPADRYRQWMETAYGLAAKRTAQPAWVHDITFSVGWATADVALLEALARVHPPRQTLIHLSTWRADKYDVNYPDYTPSPAALAYLQKAHELGFAVMPHFNYFACYEGHPVFARLRDWQVRDPYLNEELGWKWPFDTHDYTRMAYIHPGLSLWRRTLEDAVFAALRQLNCAPAAFLDQTLCTWNAANGLVENLNMVQGMRQLQEEFFALDPRLVLAGEGLNEISFQRQAFAQAHIHDGWGPLAQRHVEATHSLNAYLWSGMTRFVGYHHLSPQEQDHELGVEVYRRMGAIPTLVCNDPALITPEHPLVRRLLALVTPRPG